MTVHTELGLLDQVDGSATFEVSGTKVITSVSGPLDVVRVKNENPTEAYLDITINPAVGVASTREALLETKLRTILTPMVQLATYPRKEVQIVVQILKMGESQEYTAKELAAIVNATCLALLDSGIALNHTFWASCCSVTQQNEFVLRPTVGSLDKSVSHHVAVFAGDSLIYADSQGQFTQKQALLAMDKCAADINELDAEMRQVLLAKVKKDYVWSKPN